MMNRIDTYKKIIIKGLLFILVFITNNAYSQFEPLSTQYMNNYLLINPAYTGMHNSLAANIAKRQQWVGLDGAPTATSLSVHSPLNDSYMSVGGLVQQYEMGPSKTTDAHLTYSYLVKFKKPVMLSLGVSGGVSSSSLGLQSLSTVDTDDPYLAENIRHGIKPLIGTGAFLYTPKLFIGFSIPNLLQNELKSDEGTLSQHYRTYYLSGGYTYKFNKKWSVKPSFLLRGATNTPVSVDLACQLMYRSKFWVGASYRFDKTAALLLNLEITKNLDVCYSYEMNAAPYTAYNRSSHEIAVCYDIFAFYKKSKHRQFPKKSAVTEESMKSMRFF